jgi:hypothetical protein
MVRDRTEEFSFAVAGSPANQEIGCAAAVNRIDDYADEQQKRSQ